jgi:hypothetical protein
MLLATADRTAIALLNISAKTANTDDITTAIAMVALI